MLGNPVVVHAVIVLGLLVSARAPLLGQDSKIWAGVYSVAQAEEGKTLFEANCSSCHKLDLSGDRGPALIGNTFFKSWEAGTVNRLFMKIKETMPLNRGSSLSEDNYLALVAYILQANTFPPSKDEVELTAAVLDDIQIARKGKEGSAGIPNFALVQVVGCLARGSDGQWRLMNTSEPVTSKDQPATPQELQDGALRTLGTETFVLHSVARFKPETYRGQKMEARGLIYRSPNDSLLSLTSLQVIDSTCTQ